ncbi:HNH endonuclease [Pontibaca salina]|uniref:HNH endonuclease n=1 Tax=Pontibaca salina TaxID=2795731 RepID=A0A934M2K9_9RHOB|nr:HNH endonuclease signature motif containing protein [Pontibaca salina]MBI6630731.1 HNH endonuclease [Pontibaca salina]
MKYLARPNPLEKDVSVIVAACIKYSWAEHLSHWKTTYSKYDRHSGNPWSILPTKLPKVILERQHDLYDARKSGGPIKRIRNTKNLLSCPVCGSGTTGHVDHYLPRKVYPEFSIMSANLVPACPHCNSSVKGSLIKGSEPERFIHPYFDTWADKSLWSIKFIAPLEAVRFEPTPNGNLENQYRKIVRFHLNNVLGDQFHLSMERKWSTLPSLLNLEIKSTKSGLNSTRRALKHELKRAKVSTGKNSWETAFFRGFLNDEVATKFIHELRQKTL